MLPFPALLPLQRKGAIPVYQQIANGIVRLIRDGQLRPGASLPGSREMAQLLQVHRQTVVAAYHELNAQDWIQALPRKGVIVSARLPEQPKRVTAPQGTWPATAGFSYNRIVALPAQPLQGKHYQLVVNDGLPDPRFAPMELIMREYRRLHRQPVGKRHLMYAPPEGSPALREALAQFLADTRGLPLQPDNLLITRGAQMAIYLATRMLLRPGATVLTASPNYFMADLVFRECGARLLTVPADEHGIRVDAIAEICRKKPPDLLYIIPHHHHPTTVTLSAERRMQLAALIQEYRLTVIEDDYDYDFHYSSSPLLPLASSDRSGRVIYIGSLTKSLTASVRIGYMAAPADFIKETTSLRRLVDLRGDVLLEEALASLFRNGDIQRHLKKSLKHYHSRRDHLCALLEAEMSDYIRFRKPDGGMAVWAEFHPGTSLPAVAAKAASKGLYMSDGSAYGSNALRMGFASLNEKELTAMVGVLKKVTR